MKAFYFVIGLVCFMMAGYCLEGGINGVGELLNFTEWGFVMYFFIIGTAAMRSAYE